MTDGADIGAAAPQAQARPLWVAPLLGAFGFLSYWGFFAQWAFFRDTAWLNLLILVVAFAISLQVLFSVWSGGGWRRITAVGGTALCAAFSFGLIYYCFVLSYELPAAHLAADQGQGLPAITLTAHNGNQVDLAAADKPTIVVFYRGFW